MKEKMTGKPFFRTLVLLLALTVATGQGGAFLDEPIIPPVDPPELDAGDLLSGGSDNDKDVDGKGEDSTDDEISGTENKGVKDGKDTGKEDGGPELPPDIRDRISDETGDNSNEDEDKKKDGDGSQEYEGLRIRSINVEGSPDDNDEPSLRSGKVGHHIQVKVFVENTEAAEERNSGSFKVKYGNRKVGEIHFDKFPGHREEKTFRIPGSEVDSTGRKVVTVGEYGSKNGWDKESLKIYQKDYDTWSLPYDPETYNSRINGEPAENGEVEVEAKTCSASPSEWPEQWKQDDMKRGKSHVPVWIGKRADTSPSEYKNRNCFNPGDYSDEDLDMGRRCHIQWTWGPGAALKERVFAGVIEVSPPKGGCSWASKSFKVPENIQKGDKLGVFVGKLNPNNMPEADYVAAKKVKNKVEDGDDGDDKDQEGDDDDEEDGSDDGEKKEFMYRINSDGDIEKLNPRITEEDTSDGKITPGEIPQVVIGDGEDDDTADTVKFVFKVDPGAGLENLPPMGFYRYNREWERNYHAWTGEKKDCEDESCEFKKIYEFEAEKFFRRDVWPGEAGPTGLHSFYMPEEESSFEARPILPEDTEVEHPVNGKTRDIGSYPLYVVNEEKEIEEEDEEKKEIDSIEIEVLTKEENYRGFKADISSEAEIKSIEWDLDRDNEYEKTGEKTGKTYTSYGEKKVRVRATTQEGKSKSKTRTFKIPEPVTECQKEINEARDSGKGKSCADVARKMKCPTGETTYTATNECEISFLESKGWEAVSKPEKRIRITESDDTPSWGEKVDLTSSTEVYPVYWGEGYTVDEIGESSITISEKGSENTREINKQNSETIQDYLIHVCSIQEKGKAEIIHTPGTENTKQICSNDGDGSDGKIEASISIETGNPETDSKIKINVQANKKLAEKGYQIKITGPETMKKSLEQKQTNYEFKPSEPGEYTAKIFPQVVGQNIPVIGNKLQGEPLAKAEFTVKERGKTAWEKYCTQKGYNTKETGQIIRCLKTKVVPQCFTENPAEKCIEDGANTVAESTCRDLLNYKYKPETQKCVP